MTVAIVYFGKRIDAKTHVLLKTLQTSVASRCDTIHVFNGYELQDTDRLSVYDYLAVCVTEKPFFSSKPDPKLFELLKLHGINGAKGCTLTPGTGLFSNAFARNVMNSLESAGMRIDYFEIIRTENDIKKAGKNIG